MPLFYFHLRVGKERYPDDLGVEFSDLDAAYFDAFASAKEMWTELLKDGEDPTTRSFEIADADGKLLLTLPFKEVLEAAQNPIPPSQTVSASINLIERMETLTAALNEEIEHTRTVMR